MFAAYFINLFIFAILQHIIIYRIGSGHYSYQLWAYHLKPPKADVRLVNIRSTVLHLIGRSRMNERLPDMTTTEMLLDVSVLQKKIN